MNLREYVLPKKRKVYRPATYDNNFSIVNTSETKSINTLTTNSKLQ